MSEYITATDSYSAKMSDSADGSRENLADSGMHQDRRPEIFTGQKRIAGLLKEAFDGASGAVFAGMGTIANPVNPGLTIDGLGLIPLPLDSTYAQRIINLSEQAPFGRGDELVIDPTIRRTYQINAAKVTFANPLWIDAFHPEVVASAADILGVDAKLITTRLHKLLLYAPNGKFKYHQDTEKEPYHFATLVIVLPSKHEGGSVTAKHGEKTLVFDLAPHTAFGLAYTCLYTDVMHQVEPVLSGYRLALSYNIVYTSAAPLSALPCPPIETKAMLQLKCALKQWRDLPTTSLFIPTKRGLISKDEGYGWHCRLSDHLLAHYLEHQYSQIGLDFHTLKGKDRSKVLWFNDIVQELGLVIYLAQITIEQERTEDDYLHVPRPQLYVKKVVGGNGDEPLLTQMQLELLDFTPPLDISSTEWDSEYSTPYMGNEPGSTYHKYHRAAILCWRKEDEIPVRLTAGRSKVVLEYLSEEFNKFRQSGDANLLVNALETALKYNPRISPEVGDMMLKMAVASLLAELTIDVLEALQRCRTLYDPELSISWITITTAFPIEMFEPFIVEAFTVWLLALYDLENYAEVFIQTEAVLNTEQEEEQKVWKVLLDRLKTSAQSEEQWVHQLMAITQLFQQWGGSIEKMSIKDVPNTVAWIEKHGFALFYRYTFEKRPALFSEPKKSFIGLASTILSVSQPDSLSQDWIQTIILRYFAFFQQTIGRLQEQELAIELTLAHYLQLLHQVGDTDKFCTLLPLLSVETAITAHTSQPTSMRKQLRRISDIFPCMIVPMLETLGSDLRNEPCFTWAAEWLCAISLRGWIPESQFLGEDFTRLDLLSRYRERERDRLNARGRWSRVDIDATRSLLLDPEMLEHRWSKVDIDLRHQIATHSHSLEPEMLKLFKENLLQQEDKDT